MDIVILGAGIAGASAALALHQQGHRVRLYERLDALTTMGAGLVLWPNASFVLAELGLLPEVAAISGQPVKMRRLDPQGDSLGDIDISALNALMGYGSYSILRRDLHALLLRHLSAQGIEVAFHHCVQTIEPQSHGHARVSFTNGSRVSADLILGADGRMHSVARQYVTGSKTPIYQGFVNWIGVAQSTSAMVEGITIDDYWGIGERFGLVAVTPHKIYWAAAKAVDIADASAQQESKSTIEKMFEHWAEPIGRIIRATPDDAMRKISVHDLDPISVWHRDNVLLIGDAAHAPLPTSGQGACQALEDAWHLARSLTPGQNDLAAALTAFTQQRAAKTVTITERARISAQTLFNTDEAHCAMRNETAKASDPMAAVQAMATGWAAHLPLTTKHECQSAVDATLSPE